MEFLINIHQNYSKDLCVYKHGQLVSTKKQVVFDGWLSIAVIVLY